MRLPSLTASSSARAAIRSRPLRFGDMNGDGSLDLVVGNDGAQSLVYLNDGRGNYYDGSVGSCDASPDDVRCFGGGEDRTTSVTVADMNGDGRLDIVAGLRSGQSRVYLNERAGVSPTAATSVRRAAIC